MIAQSDPGAIVFVVLFKAVFGAICAGIASGRGRNAVGWFFIGALIDCFGLILVLVLPDLKALEAEKRRAEQENRMLREALAKERQVSDQRHGHVERRLGAHDQALGLDTSRPPELGPGTGAPPSLPAPGSHWYYARGNERMGPVGEDTLRHLVHTGAIRGDTLVWREGLADWVPLRAVDEFRGDVA